MAAAPSRAWGQLIKFTDPRTGRSTLIAILGQADGTAVIVCFGPKRHYRQAGGCRCIDACLAAMTDEFRATVTVRPWGGKEHTP